MLNYQVIRNNFLNKRIIVNNIIQKIQENVPEILFYYNFHKNKRNDLIETKKKYKSYSISKKHNNVKSCNFKSYKEFIGINNIFFKL